MRDHLSQEGRRRLAALMYSPVRCGGADYDEEGRLFYRIAGARVPEDVVRQGADAIRTWLRARRQEEESNG